MSVSIPHVGKEFGPKPLHGIIGCSVCLQSSWKGGIVGSRIKNSLEQVRDENSQIDLICCLNAGSSPVFYEKKSISLEKPTAKGSLVFFFIRLMFELQRLGTVSAMDFNAYPKTLKNFKLSEE
jgi:hypothetical protein